MTASEEVFVAAQSASVAHGGSINDQAHQLKRGGTPTWAVFGVSLGVLAPASTLGLALGSVAASVGALSWVTWLLTSVLVLGFAGGISWLSRRFSSTGGTYGLTAHTGNRPFAFLVMVAQIIAILISGPACVIGSAIYLQAWLDRIGVHTARTPILVAATIVLTLVITAMCLREVKVSAKVLLAIEFFTVGVICVLFVIILAGAHGGIIDHNQFRFHGASLTVILSTTAFAIYSMAGFDHAATLGREASNLKRAISVAMLGSVGFVGVLYVVGGYAFVLGSRGLDLSTSSAPLDILADHNHVGWLGYIIDLSVAISFFGSALGIMAGTSRTVFTMAKDRLLPSGLARVGKVHRAPVAAVGALTILYLVVGVAGCLLAEADTSYGVLGTFAGYCLVAAYGLCTIAAGIYAVRIKSLRAGIAVATLLAIAAMGLVFYYSFNPFPTGTYGTVAEVFIWTAGVTVVALIGLLVTKSRVLTQIGSADRAEA